MFRFTTAGESHGPALLAIVEGLPAGVPLDIAALNHEMWRRQQGYGRGGRMKIEQDRAEILSGVRHGETLGSPVALRIENKDWAHWTDIMSVEPGDVRPERARVVKRPRPGHADLVGGLKYDRRDLRDILERASARETAARVACGALARQLLAQFGIELRSHVVQLGGIPDAPLSLTWEEIGAVSDDAPLRCGDAAVQGRMVAAVDQAKKDGDTVGGVFEVVARGVVPGLGSHTSWEGKLDGRLAQAVMAIHAVKAVSLGDGCAGAQRFGSQVHDEIGYDADMQEFTRFSNHAGGLEGGMTNGQELRVSGYMKPIATLRRALRSIDIDTKQEDKAAFERSDVTAVPAAGVIGEAMVALVLAKAMREKFGGDSLREMKRNFDGYRAQMKSW